MDEYEHLIRYAYIKNGDVVTQLRRILPVTDTIPTSGPDAFISDFLRFVGRQPVLLISRHKRSSKLQTGNIEGRVFIGNPSSKGPLGKITSRILAFLKAFLLLLKFRPSRILCGTHGGMLWLSFLVAKLYSIPFVHSGHNSLLASECPWYKRVFAAIDKRCILCATAVICHGPYLSRQLSGMGVPSDRLFEFDIGFRDMLQESARKQEIAELNNLGKKYVLYVGRIEADKGVFDLLRACAPSLRKNSRIKLAYIGEGSQLEQLHQRVRALGLTDAVILLGKVAHETVVCAIRKAKIVVTPTRNVFPEGRCMAAMESIFLKIPVIAPDSGPFPYLVRHGSNGLLFETNSVEALREAILSVLGDDVLYSQLRKGAQESSKNLLDPPLTFSQAVQRAFSIRNKES